MKPGVNVLADNIALQNAAHSEQKIKKENWNASRYASKKQPMYLDLSGSRDRFPLEPTLYKGFCYTKDKMRRKHGHDLDLSRLRYVIGDVIDFHYVICYDMWSIPLTRTRCVVLLSRY